MPLRSLNFTKRARITKDSVEIVGIQDGNGCRFDIKLDLSSYDFPEDARVFVETWRQVQFRRFDFGRVGLIKIPEDRALIDFDSLQGVRFRVKVVADSDPIGLLVAECDGIRPRNVENQPANRISLLPVVTQDIGSQIWSLDFDNDDVLLQINSRLANPSGVATDKVFVSLVYPTIVKLVLRQVLVADQHSDLEDLDDWRSRWLVFAAGLPGVGSIPDLKHVSDVLTWIDSVGEAFSRQHRLLEDFDDNWQGGQE